MEFGLDKIRIVLAEDQPPIRQLLQFYLSSFSQVKLVATVSTGREVVEIVEQTQPTAVFLDVEMPELDGLTIAAQLREKHPEIFIVFVTAYSQYAAEAYRLEAVDYLVKPVTIDCIARALNKIEKSLALPKKSDTTPIGEGRITIKNNHEIYFINLQDILFIEKEIKKTIFHTVKGTYSSPEPLNSLEKKLSRSFFRCHKSFIINLKKVEKISPIADRIYKVTFYDYPQSVTMGRQKLEELFSIMAN